MVKSSALQEHLMTILGHDIDPDIIDYVGGIANEADLDEFMDGIVDKNNSAHITALNTIRFILFRQTRPPDKTIRQLTPIQVTKTQQSQSTSKGAKSKRFEDITKFQNKQKQKTGRQICDCEGQVHDFLNNCLNCGRIHCCEEGPGPCLFCGQMISAMGDEVRLPKQKMQPKSNKVYDDDKDYFRLDNSNKKSHESKRIVVALDFATRRIIESTEEDMNIKKILHQDMKKHLSNVAKLYKTLRKESQLESTLKTDDDLINVLVQMRHRKPAGVENLGDDKNSKPHILSYDSNIYDEEMLANTDHGVCLSMHQPYASLLVAGVKRHEGRTWSTNHRGRLWIAAAAKQADEDEILKVQAFYRKYYNDESLILPATYPTSCVLGCVYLEDCLSQEEYRKLFPNGESESPFVFICSNPLILPIFYPIVGQHKIYKLDKELHKCLQLSIRHAMYAGLD